MNLKLYAYSDEKTATVPSTNTTLTVKIKEHPPAFRILPDYAFAKDADGFQNKVLFTQQLIGSDIDTIDSFITQVIKADHISLMDTADFDNYKTGKLISKGCYDASSSSGDHANIIAGSISNIIDRDYNNYLQAVIRSTGAERTVGIAIKIKIPDIDFDFDQIYFGINAKQKANFLSNPSGTRQFVLKVLTRGFLGTTKTGLTKSTGVTVPSSGNWAWCTRDIDSIPDMYYDKNAPTSGSVNFLTSVDSSTALTGYTNFAVSSLTSADTLKTVTELGVFLEAQEASYTISNVTITNESSLVDFTTPTQSTRFRAGDIISFSAPLFPTGLEDIFYTVESVNDTDGTLMLSDNYTGTLTSALIVQSMYIVTIRELCLIYKKSLSIKTELYAPMQGRVFGGPGAELHTGNTVWPADPADVPFAPARRLANALIADPIDLLEHIKRLGNWSEIGDCTNVGKEYAPHAKINTGTDIGGFDFTCLSHVRTCCPSFQILEKNDADIISLSKEICQTYFLSSYQDNNGKECILPMDMDATGEIQAASINGTISPIPLFEYKDLYGDIGDIQEPDPQNIYCQPVMNYGYNYATGKYDAMLGVINASASVFDPSYVVGFLSADAILAQSLWGYCHALYTEFGNIETPSSTLTDKKMIRSYADATWYLKNWIWWMRTHRRRFELVTNYDKGCGLYPGMLVAVSLPHQTYGQYQVCRVEKVGLSLHKNTAKLELIMIDSE